VLMNVPLNKGWVSIHRELADKPIWLSEPFTRGQAWIDLIILANHQEGYIRVRGNKVELKRGQLGWSQHTLSLRWKWSRSKVKRFLIELEDDGNIEQQKNTVTTIISITNYNLYQNNEHQTNIKRTSSEHQTNTNNNEKKKNNNRIKEFRPPSKKVIESFFLKSNSNSIEAEKFNNYYTANGWKQGVNKISNWQAVANNWILRSNNFLNNNNTKTNKYNKHETDF
jgi:DNA replication protein DnaD